MLRLIGKIALALVVGVLALAAALLVWMKLSPMPAVLLLRHGGVFDAPPGVPAARALLDSGKVMLRRDLAYAPDTRACRENTLDVYSPRDAAGPLPTLVWVHGGGFVAGTKQALESWLPLVAEHGYTAIAVEYCKAPELHYPGQTRQVLAALDYVRTHAADLHADPSRIVLGGDSAGAHIAAQAGLAIVDAGYARATGLQPHTAPSQLRGMLLFSGTYNLLLSANSTLDETSVAARMARYMRWAYLGEADPSPTGPARYSTLQDWVGPRYPPTLIVAGNGDPLAAQSRRMAEALQRAGVATEWRYIEDAAHPVPHEFQFDLTRPDAHQVLAETLTSLARWTGTGATDLPKQTSP